MDKTIDIINNKFIYKNYDIYIIFDGDMKPWFHANAVAEILGYIRPGKAVNDHVNEKYKTTYSEIKKFDTSPIKVKSTSIYIDDPGVCCLLGASRNSMNDFKDWMFQELLPTLRKYQYLKCQEERLACLETENKVFKTLINNSQIQQMFGVLKSIDNKKKYKFIDTQKRYFNKAVDDSKGYDLCFCIEYIITDEGFLMKNVLKEIDEEGVKYDYNHKSKCITIYNNDFDLVSLVKKSLQEVMLW